jgi:hypothetical protein
VLVVPAAARPVMMARWAGPFDAFACLVCRKCTCGRYHELAIQQYCAKRVCCRVPLQDDDVSNVHSLAQLNAVLLSLCCRLLALTP